MACSFHPVREIRGGKIFASLWPASMERTFVHLAQKAFAGSVRMGGSHTHSFIRIEEGQKFIDYLHHRTLPELTAELSGVLVSESPENVANILNELQKMSPVWLSLVDDDGSLTFYIYAS